MAVDILYIFFISSFTLTLGSPSPVGLFPLRGKDTSAVDYSPGCCRMNGIEFVNNTPVEENDDAAVARSRWLIFSSSFLASDRLSRAMMEGGSLMVVYHNWNQFMV